MGRLHHTGPPRLGIDRPISRSASANPPSSPVFATHEGAKGGQVAEQEKRGWVWGEGDKFPEKLDQFERKAKNVETQIKRFADALPDLAAEATKVGRSFTETARPLIALWKGRKNKFLPLSPENAVLVVEDARAAEEEWKKFLAREDVQQAISGINRGVRAKERETRSVLADVRQQMLARFESPEYRLQLRGQVERALDQGLGVAMAALGFGAPEQRPLVRRLGVVHFIRITYEESDDRADKLAAFLRRTPPPSPAEVATEAALNLLRDDVASFDPRRRFGVPGSIVSTYLQAAIEGLTNSMRAWAKEGKTPDQIAAGYFTVLGHDFTLDARPDP